MAAISGEIAKTDDERRLVFGWAYVSKDRDGNQVTDHSGDFIVDAQNLEDKAYDFVLKSRTGGDLHLNVGVSTMIESFVITKDKREALGIPDGVLPDVAWWVGFKVHDDNVWKAYKAGERAMFSIHGKGVRKQVD